MGGLPSQRQPMLGDGQARMHQKPTSVGIVLPTCAPRLPIRLCSLSPSRRSANRQPDTSSATHSLPTSIPGLSVDRSCAPIDATSASRGAGPLWSPAPFMGQAYHLSFDLGWDVGNRKDGWSLTEELAGRLRKSWLKGSPRRKNSLPQAVDDTGLHHACKILLRIIQQSPTSSFQQGTEVVRKLLHMRGLHDSFM